MMSTHLEQGRAGRSAPPSGTRSAVSVKRSSRGRAWVGLAALALTAAIGSGGTNPAAAAVGALVPSAAVLPTLAASTQFDITGFLQTATVNTPGDPHSGGTLVVNGHHVVVPAETVVILPANALTWQELFSHAKAPYGLGATPPQTGMASSDSPKPLTTYEVHVVGNRVINGSSDQYIAGLVHLSQQDANTGVGYVNFIDYTTGEMEVGGQLGVAGTGTRVRINDPANTTAFDQNGVKGSGRYGRAFTPDDRFQVDQDNPTIMAETGFPMCIPRVTADPNVTGNADDPQCPRANRPIFTGTDTSGVTPQAALPVPGAFYTLFRMDSPANVTTKTCPRVTCADPRQQAPFEVGDYVTFAGNLIADPGGANGGQYIAAHTVTASLGIYTRPGVDPSYVSVNVSLIGTGGLTVFGAGEAAIRTRFEGMTTDETRLIRVYGIDINSQTGATTDREWGSIMPDPGPPGGAVRGRWRFRPPCSLAVATSKACTPPPAGQFIPPTREVRAVVTGLSQFLPGTTTANPASQVPSTPGATTTANGLFYGQYHAPIGAYIFPENVPGTAVPENNFNTIPFLANGGYTSITGVQAGVLNPWPSSVAPPPLVCATPTLNGAPYSVASGVTIPLSGSVPAGTSTPLSLQWTAGTTATATNLNGALSGATSTTPTFNATGLGAATYFLNFTASNPCGSTTISTTITVSGLPTPTIGAIQNQTITAGNLVTIAAGSNSLPAPTWTWTQTAGPVNPVTTTPSPSPLVASATSSLLLTPTVTGTYTFSVKATNANGTSPATSVDVVVTPAVPSNVTLTNSEYRIGKQRLVLTASSLDPLVTSMVLQPYMTDNGTPFDPATLGAANLTVSLIAPGTWTLTAVGAPKPACNLGGVYATPCAQTPLTVKSVNAAKTVIGTSVPSAIIKIRL